MSGKRRWRLELNRRFALPVRPPAVDPSELMTSPRSLVGTWVGRPKGSSDPGSPQECTWHVVDDSTCVYEQQTGMGLMISWFQYWRIEDGILRFPLSKTTRSMFKGGAQFVAIELENSHLMMNGYRFHRVSDLPVPDRHDVFPGTRPDENGTPVPHSFTSRVMEHLPEPPNGEQAGSERAATRSQSKSGDDDQAQPGAEGRSR